MLLLAHFSSQACNAYGKVETPWIETRRVYSPTHDRVHLEGERLLICFSDRLPTIIALRSHNLPAGLPSSVVGSRRAG
jgi:hypothetical protein